MKQIIYLCIIFCFSISQFFAQEKTKIEILNANSLVFYQNEQGEKYQKLTGDVIFLHDSVYMYCDTALFFSKKNFLTAFSNVYIKKGDSLNLHGDSLFYYGDKKFAKIRRNVKLEKKNEIVLTTNFLDFDLNENIGHYFNNGISVSKENILKSEKAYYYTDLDVLFFKKNVKLDNKDYEIFSDTLKYNTKKEISYFIGSTEIFSDSSYIYCENGIYEHKKNIGKLSKNVFYKNQSKLLYADSLFLDRNKNFGKAFNNITIKDTIQDIILKGNFALYKEKPEYIIITDSALLIQIDKKDSLFLHADTLISTQKIDSSGNFRTLRAFHHVKIFKESLQVKCDSLVYLFQDSTIHLFKNPVIWSEENQLTADKIVIYILDEKIDYINMTNNAFIISQKDTSFFNQIKGKNMIAYVKDNKLEKIDVNGNGESVYFAEDEKEIVGVNKSESSKMKILFKEGQVEQIKFLSKPKAILYPLKDFPETERLLKNFLWLDNERPKNKLDVF